MEKKTTIIVATVIYLLSTFASYAIFRSQNMDLSLYEKPVEEDDANEDTSPKTQACPINGALYSKNAEKEWEARRPLGIMVQNNVEARPQSGLSNADVIHEAVAEGGITRFLAIYYCESPKIVGSVRSARIYFIKLLQGFGDRPLYGHVGGAATPGPADALGEIKDLGWFGKNDLDQFGVPFPNYWRDYDRLPGRATEHTMYTNTEKLWDYAKTQRGFTNVDEDGNKWDEDWKPWSFQDDAKEGSRGDVSKISYGFWSNSLGSDYNVVWSYDPASNSYVRTNGGEKHIDLNTEDALQAKNIVIAFADESVANDGYDHGEHLLYDVVGGDDAIVFQNGKSIEGTWEKDDEEDMMRFYNESGDEIEFVRGKIWISILPTGNEVDY